MTPAPWVVRLLRCPACAGGGLVVGDDRLTCASCGHRYPSGRAPVLLPTSDAPTTIADAPVASGRRPVVPSPWIGDAMVAALPPGAVVLSVGEGYGDLVIRLAERHPDRFFVGVDVDAGRIGEACAARARLVLENCWFCVADARRLPFVDRAFAAGYARGVLHILREPEAAITELRRTVRDRLLVDQLANRPFFALWLGLLQAYDIVRSVVCRRRPDWAIWGDVATTLQRGGWYAPLPAYRRWFADGCEVTVRANHVFIWETERHRPVIGWFGCAGALDVRF